MPRQGSGSEAPHLTRTRSRRLRPSRTRRFETASTGGVVSENVEDVDGVEGVDGVDGLDGDEGVEVCTPNVAVTSRAWSIATVHVPVPEQPSPSQPRNIDPGSGVALSVTEVPFVKL